MVVYVEPLGKVSRGSILSGFVGVLEGTRFRMSMIAYGGVKLLRIVGVGVPGLHP